MIQRFYVCVYEGKTNLIELVPWAKSDTKPLWEKVLFINKNFTDRIIKDGLEL